MKMNYFELLRKYREAAERTRELDRKFKEKNYGSFIGMMGNGGFAVASLIACGHVYNSNFPVYIYIGTYVLGTLISTIPADLDIYILGRAEKKEAKLLKKIRDEDYI